MQRSNLSNSLETTLKEVGTNIAGDLIWIIIFTVGINQTDDIRCQGKMWTYSQITLKLYIIQVCARLIYVLLLAIEYYIQVDNRMNENKILYLMFLKTTCKIVTYVGTLPSFILCCIAYFDRENCNDLQILILAYIICCSTVIIGLHCLGISCCLGIIFALFIGESLQEKDSTSQKKLNEPYYQLKSDQKSRQLNKLNTFYEYLNHQKKTENNNANSNMLPVLTEEEWDLIQRIHSLRVIDKKVD